MVGAARAAAGTSRKRHAMTHASAAARTGPRRRRTAPVRPKWQTAGELSLDLGVSAQRILLQPPPGLATERDLLRAVEGDKRLCELLDGVLVEKVMGQYEGRIAAALIYFLHRYLELHPRGVVCGPDAPFRLRPGRTRLPDVSYVSYDRLPAGAAGRRPIATWTPELAVEILSRRNTRREVSHKLADYFAADVRLVWVIDPRTRTVAVHSAPETAVLLAETDFLLGSDILPGFKLRIRDLFQRAE